MNRKKKIVIGVSAAAAFLVIAAYIGACFWFKDRYWPGTVINGIPSAGLTPDELSGQLVEEIPEYTIDIVEKDGCQETVKGSQIGFAYSYPALYDIKNGQNFFLWFTGFFSTRTYEAEHAGAYDADKLSATVDTLHCVTREDIRQPEDARVEITDEGPIIHEEVPGNAIDKQKLTKALAEAIDREEAKLDLETAGAYKQPAVTLDSEEIRSAEEKIDELAHITVTYDFRYKTVELTPETIRTWIIKNDKGDYEISRDKAAAYVHSLKETEDTVWRQRPFYSTSRGQEITVEGGTYGWCVDEEGETEKLLSDIQAGKDVTREPVFTMDPFPGVTGSTDIGDTYVEIDLSGQHMWYYKDGALFMDTDVTTGTMSTGHGTPAGVFYIENRLRDTELKGEDYLTKVSYWMQVYLGVGIHDAVWRSDFGKDYYLTDGSHGCINTPYDKVQLLFDNVVVGTPVIMYY